MDLANYVRKGVAQAMQAVAAMRQEMRDLAEDVEDLKHGARSITEEIDRIPGRRLEYMLVGHQTFEIAQQGLRANPVTMQVSQDGPFVSTHYPIAMWRPSQPANATYFGFWRPVWAGWPLPNQADGAVDFDEDIIAISYEITDGGSQRNLQNEPRPPLLSMPGNPCPAPVPTLWTPNTVVNFIPTYERILFSTEEPQTTQGTLVVGLPGYRIVNM
jgi:hypothetical protein